jgi:carboxymethylenebutenolidase
MTAQAERTQVSTDDGALPAYLWRPDSGSGPGLVLVQEIFGVSRYIQQRAADLAAAGYVVLAPELYWRLDPSPIDESQPDALDAAMERVGRLDWDAAVADTVAALGDLSTREQVSGGVGLVGFCLGGGLAFAAAARERPDVLVSYYGSSIPDLLDLAPRVTAPSLHHFGLADDYLDRDTVERIRRAVTAGPGTVQFETYPGANHAFDNPDFRFHDPESSSLAWRRTVEFLHRELPVAR